MTQDNFSKQRSDFDLKDEWMTPPKVLDRIRLVMPISYDPFGNETSFVGADKTNIYDPADPLTDAFVQDWGHEAGPGGLAFMNPPFSEKAKFAKVWAHNCSLTQDNEATLFCMVPANTEQVFFQEMLQIRGSILLLYRSRLKYWERNEDGLLVEGTSPPFASASFLYGPQALEIANKFQDIATGIRLA